MKLSELKLTKTQAKRLAKEIALYGELAYRRGFQQATYLISEGAPITPILASKLRHAPHTGVYEVFEGNWKGNPMPAKLYPKKPITYRLKIEQRGNLIREIINKSGL